MKRKTPDAGSVLVISRVISYLSKALTQGDSPYLKSMLFMNMLGSFRCPAIFL